MCREEEGIVNVGPMLLGEIQFLHYLRGENEFFGDQRKKGVLLGMIGDVGGAARDALVNY